MLLFNAARLRYRLGVVMDEARQARAAALAAALAVAIGACCARIAPSTMSVERDCLSDEALARFAARERSATEKESMSKVDLRLRRVLRELESAAAQRRSSARSLAPANTDEADLCVEARVEVIVWYTGNLDEIIAAGLELAWYGVHTTGAHYATGWVAPTRLTALAAIAHVTSIDASLPMTPELNASVPVIGVFARRSRCFAA